MDALELILAVVVHPADIQPLRRSAVGFRPGAGPVSASEEKVWADGGYAGQLVQSVNSSFGWVLEIVSRPAEACGLQVLPRRCIVERTFSWFNRYRRLSKDYEFLTDTSETMIYIFGMLPGGPNVNPVGEFLTDTSETMIYIAMIHLMLKRLRPCQAA